MKYLVLVISILAIAAIALYAVSKGIDGVVISLAFTGIGGLGAWAFRLPKKRKRRKA